MDCLLSAPALNSHADYVPDGKQHSIRLLLPYGSGQKLYRPWAEICRSLSRKMADSILIH